MFSHLSARARGLAAVLLFLVMSAALNRELLPHLTNALPGNAGDPMLNAWILGWVSDAVVSHPDQLWDAPIFHPHPNTLAFSEHLVGIAIVVAPIYWLSGDAVLTYNLAFLLGFAFLGWATYALVRALTGRDDAACIAGLVVMCSPYFVSSQVARLQMLSAGWSLLTFLWLHRWLQTSARAALAGFTLCWALQLSSNVYLGLFLALPVAVLLTTSFAQRRPVLTRSRAIHLAAVALVLVAVATPPLLRYAAAQEELGLVHSVDEVQRYSATMQSYASVWHERASTWLRSEDTSDRALFPGLLLTALAVVGIGVARRRRLTSGTDGPTALAYLLIAAVVFVVTLGPAPAIGATPLTIPSPYAWLLDVVPGVASIRAPGRFAVFVVLALGVLAGVGAAGLLAGRRRSLRAGAVAAVAAFSLWDGHRDYDWLAVLPDEDPSATAAYAWLATEPPAALLEMPVVTHFQGQRPYAGGSVTLRYQLASLRHGHALVNGSSGFVTPLVTLLQSSSSPFTTLDTVDDALRALRAIGTRYIVAHRHEYLPEVLAHVDATQAAMRADTAQVEEVREFGSTIVLTLRPAPLAEPPVLSERVARANYDVSASHDEEAVAGLTDDDLTTRWRAPQHGAAWIEVQLRRARMVHGVKLAMPRVAVADYPHHLRVVGTDTAGNEHVLFDGPAAYDAALTAVFEPAEPGVRVRWAPIALTTLRLEQPVPAGDRQWTIHELHLLGDGELPD